MVAWLVLDVVSLIISGGVLVLSAMLALRARTLSKTPLSDVWRDWRWRLLKATQIACIGLGAWLFVTAVIAAHTSGLDVAHYALGMFFGALAVVWGYGSERVRVLQRVF